MLRYEALSAAPPERVWPLLAEPGRWREWAPHIRGATGLGEPEVSEGGRGVAWVTVLPVPARIVSKEPGRGWRWRVGPVVLDHRAEPAGSGSRVIVEMQGPRLIEGALAVSYGPLVALLVRNLARVAAAPA